MRRYGLSLALLWILCVALTAAQQPQADRKVWDGVYSEAQAARGKTAFENSCARCHNNALIGSERGPAIKGQAFLAKWENDSLSNLFTLIRDTMPEGAAGVVPDEVKADILSYIMQVNGYPAGTSELSADIKVLDGIKVARRTVNDGIFSAAQAERGKVAFAREGCPGCHQVDLSGNRAPALKGDEFIARWQNGPVNALFSKIRDTMPPNGPEGVSADTKIDIVSYLLQANSFPAGRTALTADAGLLDSIDIVRAGAGAGVPNFALVQTVGCLVEGPNRSWLLASATDPAATRDETSTPQLLAAAQGRALGAQRVRLISAAGYQPASQAGKKVEARGLLYRDGDDVRINLTSLQPVGGNCP